MKAVNGITDLPFSRMEDYVANGRRRAAGIDLYGVNLDAHRHRARMFEAVLSAQERSDIARLRRRRDRCRMTVARGSLRIALSAYLERAPADIPLERDNLGKPWIATAADERPLHVSCSRSGSFAVFAIGSVGPLGVDAELFIPERFDDRVGDLVLSVRERAAYASLDAACRAWWLAQAWVCKEAILKAAGCGLRIHPASVEVAALPSSRPPGGRHTWRQSSLGSEWALCTMEWSAGIVAVAVSGRQRPLRSAQLRFDCADPIAPDRRIARSGMVMS
jgi:4'-phosphopantetheinyl transferase